MNDSTPQKVWLITGAGRGLGLDIAKAALHAGHLVVATGRDPLKVAAAIGAHDNLLSIALDVTRPEDSVAAIAAAVGRFGRIDVLVNNAGNFYAGFLPVECSVLLMRPRSSASKVGWNRSLRRSRRSVSARCW